METKKKETDSVTGKQNIQTFTNRNSTKNIKAVTIFYKADKQRQKQRAGQREKVS